MRTVQDVREAPVVGDQFRLGAGCAIFEVHGDFAEDGVLMLMCLKPRHTMLMAKPAYLAWAKRLDFEVVKVEDGRVA